MEVAAMFFLTLVMIAFATIPLGLGIGRAAARRSRPSIRPIYRFAR
jgi:hypothetical protein